MEFIIEDKIINDPWNGDYIGTAKKVCIVFVPYTLPKNTFVQFEDDNGQLSGFTRRNIDISLAGWDGLDMDFIYDRVLLKIGATKITE